MEVPSYVPAQLRGKWSAVHKQYGGNAEGVVAANSWLQMHVAPAKQVREVVKFDVEVSQEGFLKRSEDGDDYVSFVLNSTRPNYDGKQFSEELLKQWADEINNGAAIVGDIDHELYDQLLSSAMSTEQVKTVLKSKKGIAKAMRAIYEDGKLWVRALIDKRYASVIKKSKGVSSEAFVTIDDDTGLVKKGTLLGFTFNVNTTPADYEAGVVA